ncbi:unnamed protein product [Agarophyton chilense]
MKYPVTLIVFLAGIMLGLYVNRIFLSTPAVFDHTDAPFHLSGVPFSSVSHNPEIKKRVLARYFQMPHVTQVAKAYIDPGQTASENWHDDMVEMFLFVAGKGVLNLDGTNYTVSDGSVALVFPPTKHTIFNTATEPLELFSIASVP